MNKLYIADLTDGYPRAIESAFEYAGITANLRRSDRVAIKPNLTFPVFRPGVMTNPEAIAATLDHLKQYTNHITICESDSGGYNRFSMDDVFRATGIADLARRYGVRVVNLSHERSRDIIVRTHLRSLRVPLPCLLTDETDLFITMPVPKVHANTTISLAVKNQWGVIQEPRVRLRLHPYFKYVIHAVNKAMARTAVIVDGKFGLTRNGPMRGDVLELNWLACADNVFHADACIARIMGFDPEKIDYLKYAFVRERIRPEDIQCNCEPSAFARYGFYLSREWTDLPGVLTFKSRLFAYLGYESFLARPLHWMLYRVRTPFY